MENITVKANGVEISVPKGTTVLEAAHIAGFEIPTLCYMKEINEIGACRICVTEVNEGRGFRLVAGCVYPCSPNMEIVTNSPKVIESRKKTLELILSTHDRKCLSCVRSGNCELQKLCKDYGVADAGKYDGVNVDEELDSATANDRAYFLRMKNALEHCKEYAGKQKELRETKSRKIRIEQGKEDIEIASSAPVTSSVDWILNYGVPTPCIGLALAIIFALANGDTNDEPDKIMTLLVILGLCIVVAIGVPVIHNLLKNKKESLRLASTEKQIEDQKKRTLFVVGQKIDQIEKEIAELEYQIRKDYLAIREDDPETRFGWKMDQLT